MKPFLITLKNNADITHEIIGDIIVNDLEKKDFSLYYNDVYNMYFTIDFRKKGFKYNVMLVTHESGIECSVTVYRNFFSIFIKKINKEKVSSFYQLIQDILQAHKII